MVSASDFLDWAKDVGVHDLGPGPAGELVLLARHAGLLDHPVIGVIQGMQFDAQFSAGIHIFAPDKFPFVGYSLPAWVDTGQESWVAAAITKGGVPLPAFRLEPGDEDDVRIVAHRVFWSTSFGLEPLPTEDPDGICDLLADADVDSPDAAGQVAFALRCAGCPVPENVDGATVAGIPSDVEDYHPHLVGHLYRSIA